LRSASNARPNSRFVYLDLRPLQRGLSTRFLRWQQRRLLCFDCPFVGDCGVELALPAVSGDLQSLHLSNRNARFARKNAEQRQTANVTSLI